MILAVLASATLTLLCVSMANAQTPAPTQQMRERAAPLSRAKSWAPVADGDVMLIKPSGALLSEHGGSPQNETASPQPANPQPNTGSEETASRAEQKPRPTGDAQRPESRRAAQTFCANIADQAADARFLAQKKQIEELQRQLDERIALLEAKSAEYRKWLARRDEFVKKAQGQIIDIYARMKPDAAAPQLAAMDEETAAALITKLNMRSASAILNEMAPEKAARLSSIIAGAASGLKVAPQSPKAVGGS